MTIQAVWALYPYPGREARPGKLLHLMQWYSFLHCQDAQLGAAQLANDVNLSALKPRMTAPKLRKNHAK
jgi:hypothetical protein